MAIPDPSQVAPWYLRNITQALALNEATGNVYVRTDAQLTISNVAGSVVQTAIHSNVITDGTVVYSGLTSSRDEVEIGDNVKKRIQLWRTAAGTPSTLTLAVAYTAANADLLWKFGWEELTN